MYRLQVPTAKSGQAVRTHGQVPKSLESGMYVLLYRASHLAAGTSTEETLGVKEKECGGGAPTDSWGRNRPWPLGRGGREYVPSNVLLYSGTFNVSPTLRYPN